MFTVPSVYFYKVEAFEEHRDKLLTFFESIDCEGAPEKLQEDVVTDWFNSSVADTHPPYFSYISKILEPELKVINETFGNHETEIVDIWFQQSSGDQRHYVHSHGQDGISCIWYLEYDPSVHNPTKFYCPFTDPLTGSQWEFDPDVKEGGLIAFPSYIQHEQRPSFSDKRRTIVSFNIKKKRESKKLGEQLTNL